jgi:hypothetical protein
MSISNFEALRDTKSFWKGLFRALWVGRKTVTGNEPWLFHSTAFSHDYKVVGGEIVNERLIMRRQLTNGEWEYRRPTSEEAYEDWFDKQI